MPSIPLISRQDFVFIVNLVKFESVETLVENLRSGNAIAKEDVITDSKNIFLMNQRPRLANKIIFYSDSKEWGL
jgi:hypothetical protein